MNHDILPFISFILWNNLNQNLDINIPKVEMHTVQRSISQFFICIVKILCKNERYLTIKEVRTGLHGLQHSQMSVAVRAVLKKNEGLKCIFRNRQEVIKAALDMQLKTIEFLIAMQLSF